MAARHHIPSRMSDAEFAAIEADPPPWLLQSRANRTGKKAVWVDLTCDVCGYSETLRPKKWWPAFDYLMCDYHLPEQLPPVAQGVHRREVEGVGSRFVAVMDEPIESGAG